MERERVDQLMNLSRRRARESMLCERDEEVTQAPSPGIITEPGNQSVFIGPSLANPDRDRCSTSISAAAASGSSGMYLSIDPQSRE